MILYASPTLEFCKKAVSYFITFNLMCQQPRHFFRNAFPNSCLSLSHCFFIEGGVDTAAVGSTYDISNLDRLGFSEVRLNFLSPFVK